MGLVSAIGAAAMGLYQLIYGLMYMVAGVVGLRRLFDSITCRTGSLVRRNSGGHVVAGALESRRPKELLRLYEYENCPFCRKVREAISALDLDVMMHPCPRETLSAYGVCELSRHRPTVERLGGKLMFPFLVDPNGAGASETITQRVQMYQSDAIVEYLYASYGEKCRQRHYTATLSSARNLASSGLSTLVRPLTHMGVLRAPSRAPADENALHLWSFEASTNGRMVREVLCMLELSYVYHSIATGCDGRKYVEMQRRLSAGNISVASITSVEMVFEDRSVDGGGFITIDAYEAAKELQARYQVGEVAGGSFFSYSTTGASREHGTLGGK